MRRLVVGRVLPTDAHAVSMVVHQRRYPVPRLRSGGVDIQCSIILSAPQYEFLTPVTEDVSRETGCRFRAVAR